MLKVVRMIRRLNEWFSFFFLGFFYFMSDRLMDEQTLVIVDTGFSIFQLLSEKIISYFSIFLSNDLMSKVFFAALPNSILLFLNILENCTNWSKSTGSSGTVLSGSLSSVSWRMFIRNHILQMFLIKTNYLRLLTSIESSLRSW